MIHGNMDVGRGVRGLAPLWILKFLGKKVVFLVLSGKKQISPLCTPPWKNFGKIPQWPPLEKILPTPMHGNSVNGSNAIFLQLNRNQHLIVYKIRLKDA